MKGFRGEWLQDKSVRAKVGRCKRGKGALRRSVSINLAELWRVLGMKGWRGLG